MKKAWISVLLSLSLLVLSACGTDPGTSGSSQPESPSANAPDQNAGGEGIVEKSYGSFAVPADWYEVDELSGDSMAFYLKVGTPLDVPTSNISVSEGANNYAADDYMSFAQAIDLQLRSQVGAMGGSFTGGGSYTDRGYPLISMNIQADGMTTIQHYIVGDYRFVMVHATDFDDPDIPDLADAALAIVNSFEWAE